MPRKSREKIEAEVRKNGHSGQPVNRGWIPNGTKADDYKEPHIPRPGGPPVEKTDIRVKTSDEEGEV